MGEKNEARAALSAGMRIDDEGQLSVETQVIPLEAKEARRLGIKSGCSGVFIGQMLCALLEHVLRTDECELCSDCLERLMVVIELMKDPRSDLERREG